MCLSLNFRFDDRGMKREKPLHDLRPKRSTRSAGRPIRGARSLSDGEVSVSGLVDIEPGTKVIVTAYDGKNTVSRLITTVGPPSAGTTLWSFLRLEA